MSPTGMTEMANRQDDSDAPLDGILPNEIEEPFEPLGEPEEGESSESPFASPLEALRSELHQAQDRHLRLAAEFDNYRRRSGQQLADAASRAQAALLARVVDILDDLMRVTSLDAESASAVSVVEGVTLLERKLMRLLEEAGLEEIDPVGAPFDPNQMEALARVAARSPQEDDQVEQVFQRGFRFQGHLIRPARVSVRKVE